MLKIAILLLPWAALAAFIYFFGWLMPAMAATIAPMLILGSVVVFFAMLLPEKYSPNWWQTSTAVFILWMCVAYFMYLAKQSPKVL